MRRRVARYELSARLGQGGSGEVYRALDPLLRREVAVKLVVGLDALTPEEQEMARTRFAREVHAAAAVKHPNVVDVHDVGEEQGVPFIVMELVGSTLARLIGTPLSLATMGRILLDIARGLEAIHAAGFTHRDVKPSNILVDATTMTAKVADLGLIRREAGAAGAETASFATATGSILGTPRYMAPEQLVGLRADHRTDQFGWGLLAIELLTGKRRGVGRMGAPSADELAAMPARFTDIVQRATREDMGQRYPTTSELVRALEGVLAQVDADSLRDTVESRAPEGVKSPADKERRSPRASRALLVTIFVLAAVSVLGLGGLIAVLGSPRWRDPPDARRSDGAPAMTDDGGAVAVVVPPPEDARASIAAAEADADASTTAPTPSDVHTLKKAGGLRVTAPDDPNACLCMANVSSAAQNGGSFRSVCVIVPKPICICRERKNTRALCREPSAEMRCPAETGAWPVSAWKGDCRGYPRHSSVMIDGQVACDFCPSGYHYAGAKHGEACRGTSSQGFAFVGRWACRAR